MRIGLIGTDSSHADDFLRHFNGERRHPALSITALRDEDAAHVAELRESYPELRLTRSIDELVAGVDAVIVGSRDGALHLSETLPALAAGRPVFVDKPLANSVADAEAMVAAAERSGVPLLSGSALRWQPEMARLKARLEAGDRPAELSVRGTWYPDSPYGGSIFYAIHAIEMAQELAGIEWTNFERTGATSFGYDTPRLRLALDFRPANASGGAEFAVALRIGGRTLEQPIVLGDDYMAPVVDVIAAMLKTGRASLGPRELLAPVGMMAEIETLLGG